MNTLSFFPDLLTFSMVGPLLIRLSVGFFILYLGRERLQKPVGFVSIFYFACALFLMVGLYTQLAAILGIIILKIDFYSKRIGVFSDMNMFFLYAVSITVLLSLLFTGPGFMAFDLPL
ncbi:MAG: hypothetical protein V4690_02675 [Patescibacteria group bacterium]